jgi:formate hydrogenlyase subunit 3/multisubunit Na+/H+ antiporter MnhD subunit
MMLGLLLAVPGLFLVTGLLAALVGRSDRASRLIGTTGCVVGSGLGLAGSLIALLRGERAVTRFAWTLPVGELRFGIDPLSSFFLLCIFLVGGLAAAYGGSYLHEPSGRRRVAPALAFFPVLVAAMAGVVLARDAMVLMVAWEVMSVASFLLVTFEHDRPEVRRAGLLYLIASQAGAACLLLLFAVLGRAAGSYDFDRLGAAAAVPGLATTAFLLAVAGFGTKAGFWPLHVWLPDAHPAAPTHVSALMSGVMIKMGIYGLLRTLTFLGPPPTWWGALMIVIGSISGIVGVLLALAQHDLKRLLAYHSVENIGIIALGIGLGLLAESHHDPMIAYLGFGGALLHVLNHGIFKGLLFQSAGSIQKGTGTRDIESLGGLLRNMPVTGAMFMVGSIAICGLPPLNGFVSEWLMFVGAMRGGAVFIPGWTVFSIVVVVALALIGGLATACFVKAFGIVFLGEPRGDAVRGANESGWGMRTAMSAGALLCVVIGVWPAGAMRLVMPAVADLTRTTGDLRPLTALLNSIARSTLVLAALVLVLGLGRKALLRGRTVSRAPTWGCGYEAPSARMQYTAESFGRPLLEPFALIVGARVDASGPEGVFPAVARYQRHIGDMAGERVFLPAYGRVLQLFSRVRGLQHGRIQLYLAYILITLIVLLVWQLSAAGGR